MRTFASALAALAVLSLGGAAIAQRPATTPGSARSNAPAKPVWLESQYGGKVELEGHYRRPGDTRRYWSRQHFFADTSGRMRLDWTTWSEGEAEGAPESWLVAGGAVYRRDAPGDAWQRVEGERAHLARLQVVAGLPWLATRVDALEARLLGNARRPRSIVDRRAHPRLGDVVNRVDYGRWQPFPDRFRMTLDERDHSWTLNARFNYVTFGPVAESLLALPDAIAPARSEAEPSEPTVHELAPGVWAIDQEDVDSRTLVVEFTDHVALVELAVGSANGERIVDLVKRRWPSKPIQWALFSHHHPHYTGGLRAAIAEGARVVTTKGNVEFVKRFAARRFTIAPDRLARAPRKPDVRAFTGRLVLSDQTNELVAVDIGSRSDHTDEFAVFWLPRAKLVFQTEQGWGAAAGVDSVRASRRAAGFLKALDDEKISADRFVQSWPMRGLPREVTRARLEELIAQRGK